jgi:hypothetical protein
LHTGISGDSFRTIASESKNDFVEMSFMSSLRGARSHLSMLIEKQRRDASKISESLRNFGGSQSSKQQPSVTTFTHVTDPSSISREPTLAGVLARFLRLKMWDFVCHLSELRAASKH